MRNKHLSHTADLQNIDRDSEIIKLVNSVPINILILNEQS